MELYFSNFNESVNNECWFWVVKTVDHTKKVLEMWYGQISWLSDVKSEWCKKTVQFFFQSVTPPNIASRKFYLSARKFSDQRETSWSKIFNGLSFVRKWRCLVDFLKSKYTSIVKVQSKDDRCSIYPLSNVKNYGLIKLLSDSINNFVWVKSRFENLFIHGTRQRDHIYHYLG